MSRLRYGAIVNRPYHHGDLRRALLAAAWSLLDEGGLDAITLRAVARRASVSHAAPHHHFASKAALVEAMVVQALEWFAGDLQRAWDDGLNAGQDPLAALRDVGLAYLRFARGRPHVFALLNRPELRRPAEADSPDRGSVVGAAAEQAYLVLVRGVVASQQAGQIARGDPAPWALLAWSGVHGLAMILTDGLLDAPEGLSADDVAGILLDGLQHGLAVRP